jgi:hypothetical protein
LKKNTIIHDWLETHGDNNIARKIKKQLEDEYNTTNTGPEKVSPESDTED